MKELLLSTIVGTVVLALIIVTLIGLAILLNTSFAALLSGIILLAAFLILATVVGAIVIDLYDEWNVKRYWKRIDRQIAKKNND